MWLQLGNLDRGRGDLCTKAGQQAEARRVIPWLGADDGLLRLRARRPCVDAGLLPGESRPGGISSAPRGWRGRLPREAIADAGHREDEGGAAGVEFDLLPEAPDVDVDDALALHIGVVAPDGIEDLGA